MAGAEGIIEDLGKFGNKLKEFGTKGLGKLKGAGKRVGESFEHGYPSKVLDRLGEPSTSNGRIRRATRAVGRFGAKVGAGTAKGVGKGLTNAGNSKAIMAGVGALAFAKGVGHVAGPALHDAAMETAFGDPNADTSFTGRRFNTRYLAGSMMGGIGGSAMRLSSPRDYLYQNPFMPPGAMAAGSAFVAAPVGALVGGGIGASIGATVGNALGGRGGKIAGGIAGGLIGGIAGGGTGLATPFAAAKHYVGHNKKFFSESPYNSYSSSSATANALNASGDIVLGMHNSRRGY